MFLLILLSYLAVFYIIVKTPRAEARNLDGLEAKIKEEWYRMREKVCQKLVKSTLARCHAVKKRFVVLTY